MGTTEEIRANRTKRRKAMERVEVIDAELAELVKRALSEGMGPTEIARIAGLSRERIYQIRDGRR